MAEWLAIYVTGQRDVHRIEHSMVGAGFKDCLTQAADASNWLREDHSTELKVVVFTLLVACASRVVGS